MRADKLFGTSAVIFVMLSMVTVSCSKKSNPAAPVGIDFHITNPKNGDSLSWGVPLTIKWTLPANGSIDTVVVYRKPQGGSYEALNMYFPVVAPADSFNYFIGSDVPAGQTEKFRIQNYADSTQFDEVTINIKS